MWLASTSTAQPSVPRIGVDSSPLLVHCCGFIDFIIPFLAKLIVATPRTSDSMSSCTTGFTRVPLVIALLCRPALNRVTPYIRLVLETSATAKHGIG